MNDLPPETEGIDSSRTSRKQTAEEILKWEKENDELTERAVAAFRKRCEDYEKEHGKPMPPPKFKW